MAIRDTVTGLEGFAAHRACGFASRCLAGVVLLLGLACVSAGALAANAVDIAATLGFSDTFRPGHWTPLAVTVTNRGADFSGELEVQVTGDDALRGRELVTYHRRALELNREARKTQHFVVHPQGLSYPLVIRVRSGGQELARTEVELRTRFAAQRLLLVLSRNAGLDHLNDGAAEGLRVLYPHPELLPRHWRGYDAVAAVVLHGVSLERLSTSQYEALHKWIAQGGILAVSGGADYALLRTSRLAALLPGVPQGMTPLDAGELQRAFSDSLDSSQAVHVNRLGAFRGRVRLAAGEVPLIVEREIGHGRIVYLTFDVAAPPFDRWEGMRALLLDHLHLPAATASSVSAPEPGVETPLAALIRATAPDFPASSTVFLFLLLYLGVLLAAYAIPSRGARHRRLAALCGWAAPVVFAPAAWLLFGPAAFPRGASAAAVALIEPLPDSGYARLAFELGLYANRNGTMRLEYRGAEPVLAPHRQARREGKVEDWVFGQGPRPYVEPLDRRRYVLHALEGEDVIAFRIEAALHDERMGPRIALTNASGRTLEDLWLVYGGHAYELGSVEAGARLDRRLLAATHGIELGATSVSDVLKAPAGIPAQLLVPTRLMLKQHLQQLGSRAEPGPGHGLLIAHTASPLRPGEASSDWQHQERAVVALRVVATAAASADASGEQAPRSLDPERAQSTEAQGAAPGAAKAR
jgi:hypothetical protein